MFDSNQIKKTIAKYVDNGAGKFAIFPYGVNGEMVENILKNYFDIHPAYIVDNQYYKYNNKIISLLDLEAVYQPDMYVFLTIEDSELNRKLYEELCRFVPAAYIINLLEKRGVEYPAKVKDQFELKAFLPELECERSVGSIKGKIKIRIFHDTITTWNAISSICRALMEDDEIDLRVIVSWTKLYAERYIPAMVKQVKENGYPYILEDSYDVADDRPDILILVHPDAKSKIMPLKYRKYVKMIVVASMALIRYDSHTIQEFAKLCENFMQFCPDYWLFDSLLYREAINCSEFCGKVVEMGNVAFDDLYEACVRRNLPAKWDKIKNKKCVLWTTDHGIYWGYITNHITFDLYAKTIFMYAKQNPDIGIIFRPHPTFIKEMLINYYWSQEEFEQLKEYIENTDNMVFDESDTYAAAFAIADAILMDGFGGMLCAALPILKPVGVMYRNKGDDWLHPEITDTYYKIYQEEDMINFLDNVLVGGKDSNLELRKTASMKYVKHFDGKNGERIKEYIKKEFKEKF